MSGRGFSGSVPVGTPVFVTVPGTKKTSLFESYGQRNTDIDIEVIDSSGISKTIIGPYQIPTDTTKSWYLDVWDGEANAYRTLLLPSSSVFDVTNWSPSSQITQINVISNEIPSGNIDGSNKVFTLANTPVAGSVTVYLNGLQLQPGQDSDYTVVSKNVIFIEAPTPGDSIRISYCK